MRTEQIPLGKEAPLISRRKFLKASAEIITSLALARCAPSSDSRGQRIIPPPWGEVAREPAMFTVSYEGLEMTFPAEWRQTPIGGVGKVLEVVSPEVLPDTGGPMVKVAFGTVAISPAPENQEEKLSTYARWVRSNIRDLESEMPESFAEQIVRLDYTTVGPNLPREEHIRIGVHQGGNEFVDIHFQIHERASEGMRERVNQIIDSIGRAVR